MVSVDLGGRGGACQVEIRCFQAVEEKMEVNLQGGHEEEERGDGILPEPERSIDQWSGPEGAGLESRVRRGV